MDFMNNDKIRQKVRSFIARSFLRGQGSKEFKNDCSFLKSGIIDSTGILELVNFVQNTFSIRVEDEEIIPDNFDSLDKLVSFIVKKHALKYSRMRANKDVTPDL